MAKSKKKHSKKDQASANILDVAALSLKKFRKVTREIGKLSTGQKVVGGLALVAVGLAYMATQAAAAEPGPDSRAAPRLPKASHPAAASAEDASGEPAGAVVPALKSRKSTRAR